MTESLKALLAGAIDYAGMFPPAALSLEQAIANYRAYLAGPEAWLLGRFLCPAERLRELADLYRPAEKWRVAAVIPSVKTNEATLSAVEHAIAAIQAFPAGVVDTFELRWPEELLRDDLCSTKEFADFPQNVAWKTYAAKLHTFTFYFEFPIEIALKKSSQGSMYNEAVAAVLAQADCASDVDGLPYMSIKFRTGGPNASDIPTSAELAALIRACPVGKVTAGLHHAMRHFDPHLGVPMHGFLNVFCAAVFARDWGRDASEVEEILNNEDASRFRFTDEELGWKNLASSINCIRPTRLDSFGSCSFEEPVQDLKDLGLL